MNLSPLQFREVFHLEFLRELVKKIPPSTFVLKGGSNLRFFFGSIRYSEDMDLDVEKISMDRLQERTLAILKSKLLLSRLRTFGIDEIIPADMKYAKQTQIVQHFKTHLITSAGEDLFTKIEFSRRGFDASSAPEAIDSSVLSRYLLPPIIVPHYSVDSAVNQKITALLSRRKTEARDIFDLYVLHSQIRVEGRLFLNKLSEKKLKEIRDKIYAIDYEQYRDTVVLFLSSEDQAHYNSQNMWDEMRLIVLSFIDRELKT